MRENIRQVREEQEDMEIEERLPRDRFVGFLRDYADALESGEPFTAVIGGAEICAPVPDETAVEYEADDEKGELEFTAKWKAGKKLCKESIAVKSIAIGLAALAGASVAVGTVALIWSGLAKRKQ